MSLRAAFRLLVQAPRRPAIQSFAARWHAAVAQVVPRRAGLDAGGAKVRGVAEGPTAPGDSGTLGVRVPASRAFVLDEQAFGGDLVALGDALSKLGLPHDVFSTRK